MEIYLVAETNRFRLPLVNTPETDHRPESALLGIQLAQLRTIYPVTFFRQKPAEPETRMYFDFYDYAPFFRDESWNTGQLRTLQVTGGPEHTHRVGQFDFQSPVDLAAVWAMATIYHDLGRNAFATNPSLKKILGHFGSKEIELPEPYGICPIWRIARPDGSGLYLIVPRIKEQDPSNPVRDSLAMALYALLEIMEQRYQRKTKEQLGEPGEHPRTGEATRRIFSAGSIFHQS